MVSRFNSINKISSLSRGLPKAKAVENYVTVFFASIFSLSVEKWCIFVEKSLALILCSLCRHEIFRPSNGCVED